VRQLAAAFPPAVVAPLRQKNGSKLPPSKVQIGGHRFEKNFSFHQLKLQLSTLIFYARIQDEPKELYATSRRISRRI